MPSLLTQLFGKSSRRRKLDKIEGMIRDLQQQQGDAGILAAQTLVRQNRAFEAVPLAETEFKVYSQFGDDGIIQYVVNRLKLPLAEQRFVEFGVETYREANTRFLLVNDNWSGLIMDGSPENIATVRRDDIYWRHELTAEAHFITRENINELIGNAGFRGRIGLLSVDIDGNDYWVWQAITVIDPAVVIVEYNGVFGSKEAVTVPYRPDFVRSEAHYSRLYSGASLAAFCALGRQKGYVWIGCNRAGNNAYFVRQEYANLFAPVQMPADFVAAKFRETRNAEGKLTFQGQATGASLLGDLPVHDVIRNETRFIRDLQY